MKHSIPFLILLVLLTFVSCDVSSLFDDEGNPIMKSSVETDEVTDVMVVSAVFSGTIKLDLTKATNYRYGIICSDNDNPEVDHGTLYEASGLNDNHFTVTISELTPDTKYRYRAFVQADGIYHYGKVRQFSTHALPAASVVTGDILQNSYNQATVSGSVNIAPLGFTHHKVCVAYSLSDPHNPEAFYETVELAPDGSFTATIHKANPMETYNFCTMVIYANQPFEAGRKLADYHRLYGEVRSLQSYTFTSSDIDVAEVTRISFAAADFHAIETSCADLPDFYYYGVACSRDENPVVEGNTLVAYKSNKREISVTIKNLEPATHYYYRSFIEWNGVNVYSEQRSFVTAGGETAFTSLKADTLEQTRAVITVEYQKLSEDLTNVSSVGLLWSETPDLSFDTANVIYGEYWGEDEYVLRNLKANTTYHCRAFINFESEHSIQLLSNPLTFTTPPEEEEE